MAAYGRRLSLRALVTAAFLLPALGGAAPAASPNPLRVAGDQSYPPIAYLEGGVPRGFDVDVVKALAGAINRDVRVQLLPWDVAQDRVRRGQGDCLIGMSITEERRKTWDFATPTLTHTFSLFITSTEVAIRGVGDLAGKRVGVTAGGLPRTFLESRAGVSLALVANYEEGFELLKKGAVDAVAADTWVAGYILNKYRIDGVAAAGPPFATLDSAIAVPKGQHALLREINAGLATLQSQGTLDEIRRQWEPKQVVYLLKEQVTTITVAAAGIAGSILLAAMLAWILTLRREIRVRKGVENELRTSEERFRVLVEHAPEAVIVYDFDAGRIVDVNANAEHLFGRSRARLLQLGPEQLHSPVRPGGIPQVPSFEEVTARALAGEQLVFERNIRNALGQDTLCEVRLVRLPAKRASLLRASMVDISRRKRAEEALNASEEKFRTAFMTLPDAIIVNAYPDATIAEVNEGFERMFGYTRDEAIGSTALELGLFFDPADRDRLVAAFGAQGSVTNFELRGQRKSGEVFFGALSSNITSISGTNFAVHVIRDVTERKVAAKKLEEAFGKLKLLSGRLLNAQEIERRAIASELHDEIGQALTAVTLKLHVLGKRIADGTATAADVESCMGITDSALKQVRDLSLDLRPPQLDLMGLEAALRWLLATRTEGTALNAHLGIYLLPHGRDQQTDITCFRIVQEALTNVIRHARAANLWVEATQANGAIELRIRDDGCGFDSDAAMARAAQGSSVGLLSMQERVVLLGGAFEIESRPGAGTTIRARIPLPRETDPVHSGSRAVP